jgi:hypothetical protein
VVFTVTRYSCTFFNPNDRNARGNHRFGFDGRDRFANTTAPDFDTHRNAFARIGYTHPRPSCTNSEYGARARKRITHPFVPYDFAGNGTVENRS